MRTDDVIYHVPDIFYPGQVITLQHRLTLRSHKCLEFTHYQPRVHVPPPHLAQFSGRCLIQRSMRRRTACRVMYQIVFGKKGPRK